MNRRERQKIKNRRGPKFSKIQSWNMTYHLARIISGGVHSFRLHNTHTYPGELTPEEWSNNLKEIEWVFNEIADEYKHSPYNIAYQLYLDGKAPLPKFNEQMELAYSNRIKNGLALFSTYFEDMWD